MKIYLLRHASTQYNSKKSPSEWHLSPEGKQQAENIVKQNLIPQVDKIICSSELKTHSTIKPYSDFYHLPINKDLRFNEVGSTHLPIDIKLFQQFRRQCFNDFDMHLPFNDNESFRDAYNRFQSGIADYIKSAHNSILIVSHGCILSIFFAMLNKISDNGELIYKNWQNLQFCSLGVIENGKIIRNLS
ncbi:histidine phosphatase family protein [Promethearchaeum syntrophicum]|uniref:Histidine phosphatase family protein n=1 Tax=Promethearchaeum syntrophicum TaxID=2594042 RepID=A0A5B9DF45_9ARCH|nr:histidine phosphatase family protein [Candidatus Prometheoarchaeum syntrophicum]QEE17898.1 phosphoglycerate mutase GpmB [Candidatus Prometheoarchaeum syntrophicum]